jgi:hypothetical protein
MASGARIIGLWASNDGKYKINQWIQWVAGYPAKTVAAVKRRNASSQGVLKGVARPALKAVFWPPG